MVALGLRMLMAKTSAQQRAHDSGNKSITPFFRRSNKQQANSTIQHCQGTLIVCVRPTTYACHNANELDRQSRQ